MTPNPQWELVESSQIEAIAYSEPHLKLYIRFKNGSVYEYMGVYPEAYESLRNAESVGKHFHAYIKGEYAYNRIQN